MEYKVEDLKKAFIRVRRGGRWHSISADELTDLEFKNWVADRLYEYDYTPTEIELPYKVGKPERVYALNKLYELGIKTYILHNEDII